MHLPNKRENCVLCGIGSLLLTLFISICGGIVSYYVFQLIYMTNYYDQAMSCKTSNLWEYLLVSCFTWLMFTFVGKAISLHIEFVMEKIIFMSIPTVYYISMVAWGSFELYYGDRLCQDLRDTSFEKIGLVNVIIQIILLIFSLSLLIRFSNINH